MKATKMDASWELTEADCRDLALVVDKLAEAVELLRVLISRGVATKVGP
jgi:hypothetical protein